MGLWKLNEISNFKTRGIVMAHRKKLLIMDAQSSSQQQSILYEAILISQC